MHAYSGSDSQGIFEINEDGDMEYDRHHGITNYSHTTAKNKQTKRH